MAFGTSGGGSGVTPGVTEGGPGTMTETISIYTYDRGFRQFDTSYTGAIAFLVVVLLSLVVLAALRRMEIDR